MPTTAQAPMIATPPRRSPPGNLAFAVLLVVMFGSALVLVGVLRSAYPPVETISPTVVGPR